MIKGKFKKELTSLINRHCVDNETNIPDYILANFLCWQILNLKNMTKKRDIWFGFKPLQDPLAELRPNDSASISDDTIDIQVSRKQFVQTKNDTP